MSPPAPDSGSGGGSSNGYYQVLGITTHATDQDIRKAYKTLALKWHPDKNPENKEVAERKFKEIAEAFTVLSDRSKRDTYDRYGDGGANNDYGSQAYDTFREFFGGRDPFQDFFSASPFNFDDRKPSAFDSSSPFNSGQRLNNIFSFDPFNTKLNGDTIFSTNTPAVGGGAFFSTTSFSAGEPGKSANVKKTSTSTKYVNGKCVVTKKIIESGCETIEILEDGKLMSRTVNGMAHSSPAETIKTH